MKKKESITLSQILAVLLCGVVLVSLAWYGLVASGLVSFPAGAAPQICPSCGCKGYMGVEGVPFFHCCNCCGHVGF